MNVFWPVEGDRRWCQLKGQFANCMKTKNPCAQNIIFNPYSITATNPYFPHSGKHIYTLYDKIANYGDFAVVSPTKKTKN